jgi:hypothetical protein
MAGKINFLNSNENEKYEAILVTKTAMLPLDELVE